MPKITVHLGKKGRQIDEPPFFLLREIIATYNQLAQTETQSHALKALFALLFGKYQGYWLLLRLKPTELSAFLTALPGDLGLEDNPKPASGDAWGDLYAHLSASFGWEYDVIDRTMTLSKLKAMHGYLHNHPPTHLLVAAYLNYQPELPKEEKRRRFFDRFTGAG